MQHKKVWLEKKKNACSKTELQNLQNNQAVFLSKKKNVPVVSLGEDN